MEASRAFPPPPRSRDLDADTITRVVIGRHAAAREARTREVMTSLVQHLHAFARDVRLTEAEWVAGVRFLADCARRPAAGRPEIAQLSDALGLSALVAALQPRRPGGSTATSLPGRWDDGFDVDVRDAATGPRRVLGSPEDPPDRAEGGPDAAWPWGRAQTAGGEPCLVRGRVVGADGAPIAGARVRVAAGAIGRLGAAGLTDAQGGFAIWVPLPPAEAFALDGPVAMLLRRLGREPRRPAHLHFEIDAAGHEPLSTQVFRGDDPDLDADALFGVRRSLVAEWRHHPPGPTPDGRISDSPFTTVDFDFVLNPTTGDKR